MADFEVKIATDAREIEQAQRLRFNVFNLELIKDWRRRTSTAWISAGRKKLAEDCYNRVLGRVRGKDLFLEDGGDNTDEPSTSLSS